jgi:aspartate carbamoyltransferase catalytic subunit
MAVNLAGRDILSMRDFSREEMDYIFDVTEKMEPTAYEHTKLDLLSDKILATLFFQASTRTRLSFEAAMHRLGGSVIGFASPEVSRSGDQYKETFGDTARVLDGYVDIVTMRHFQVGAPADYASFSKVPMINGGDGFGEDSEHPTQALIDMYTIKKLRGSLDGMKMLIIGDGRFRTIHSYGFAFPKYEGIEAYLLVPEEASALKTVGAVAEDPWLPEKNEKEFKELGFEFKRVKDIDEVLDDVDVIAVHGIVKDRTEQTPKHLQVTSEVVKRAKKDVIVLHPLPRLDELTTDVDDLPNAHYFFEAHVGVPLRMALLTLLLGKPI